MKLSYDVFIRHEVYRALQGASAHDQERVSDFIESLAGNPFREGDATIPDEHGRAIQVKMLGRLVLSIGLITPTNLNSATPDCREDQCTDLADECESFTLNRGMMANPETDRLKVWPRQFPGTSSPRTAGGPSSHRPSSPPHGIRRLPDTADTRLLHATGEAPRPRA